MKTSILLFTSALCACITLVATAQSNLDYLNHLVYPNIENLQIDNAEEMQVTKSPFGDQYFSRFSAIFNTVVELDLSLGSTPEYYNLIPLCSTCLQTVFRLHESNNLSETFSLIVQKSSPLISNNITAAGFQYGPNGYMIDLILDTVSVAHIGNEVVQNESSVYRTAELMLFDYNQSMFYNRLTKFKDETNYIQTVRIDRAKYNTLVSSDTYCLDFSFSDTVIVSNNLDSDTLFASERGTYLHVVNNELQEYKGMIEYDGTLILQISVVVGNSVYRVYEISGTANLEPTGIFTYSTPENHRELILVKYGPESNVIWVRKIAVVDAGSMVNPGIYIVKMVPNEDYLALGYYFRANPNGGNNTGTFYSYSDSGIIESGNLLVSGQYRNSPFYLNMLTASDGETIKSYTARFTENPTSFAMRFAGTIDIDYFDQGLIALQCKHHTQLQSALSLQLIYPTSSLLSEGNLPTMPLESEFYIVPVQGFDEPEKVILTAQQETGGSNFALEIAPYGENQFLFSGFYMHTIHLNFLNYPSFTLSNSPDPYFGTDGLVLFAEKPANSLEDRPASVFSIYPNPAEFEIYVGSHPNYSTYSIRELTGKEIKMGSLHNQQSIRVNELPSGMYILKLTDNLTGQNTSHKFVKQ